MELAEDIQVASHQAQPKEGSAEIKEGILEDKIVPQLEDEQTLATPLEDEHSVEDLKDKDLQIKTEKETIDEEHKAQGANDAGESHKDPVKKPQEAAKQKAKVTVPQPFSLATARMSRERQASVDFSSSTDRRTPRERRSVDFSSSTERRTPRERQGSVNFNNMQPKLSKSMSLNKPHSSGGARETHKRGHENSAAPIIKRTSTSKVLRPQVGDNKEEVGVKNQRKIKATKDEKNNSQVTMKQQEQKGETAETRKLGNSSTFKALPLPSFYHRNDPTAKPSTKKVSSPGPKSPLLAQRSKHSNSASDAQKKSISNSAKQTMSKLLKGTRKALIPSKEMAKGVVVTA